MPFGLWVVGCGLGWVLESCIRGPDPPYAKERFLRQRKCPDMPHHTQPNDMPFGLRTLVSSGSMHIRWDPDPHAKGRGNF